MQKQYKIGICFGVWDLFHIGHLNILKGAKELCEKLYVCVSTDEYVEKNKGKKPVYNYYDRKRNIKTHLVSTPTDELVSSY
jgi:glycerol-3-phosphate cytidylyltransferase